MRQRPLAGNRRLNDTWRGMPLISARVLATLTAVWMGNRELGGALQRSAIRQRGPLHLQRGLRESPALNAFAAVAPESAG